MPLRRLMLAYTSVPRPMTQPGFSTALQPVCAPSPKMAPNFAKPVSISSSVSGWRSQMVGRLPVALSFSLMRVRLLSLVPAPKLV